MTQPITPTHAMQCMEIWGGNHAVDDAISVPGMDAWVFSQPYRSLAGGDIHYVSMCGGGRISRFLVSDVSGHGEAVASLAARLRGLMRKHINTLDQARFVRALNREFSSMAGEGRFATALLATYFAPTDHLLTCNAGHPPPLWYRVQERAWQPLTSDSPECVGKVANLPLGVIRSTAYEQFAVPMVKDDLVLIYTDALTEAMNAAGTQLGLHGLIEIVNNLDVGDARNFCRALLDAVSTHRGDQPADDDVTLLLLQHNAADPPKRSLGETMKVMGKMLGIVRT